MIFRTRFELGRRSIGNKSAVGDNHRPRADSGDLFENVRRNNHDFVAGKILNKFPHMLLLVGVQAIGRFVQNQHFGVVHDCLREANPALKPFRQCFDFLQSHRAKLDFGKHASNALHKLVPAVASNLANKS